MLGVQKGLRSGPASDGRDPGPPRPSGTRATFSVTSKGRGRHPPRGVPARPEKTETSDRVCRRPRSPGQMGQARLSEREP